MNRKLLVIAIAVAIAGGGYAFWQAGDKKPALTLAKTPVAAARPDRNTLHFAEGASQLDYIKTTVVTEVPEPAIEALPARVAMNDDISARVYTPVNGRVLRIMAEPGDKVRKGQALVELDAPDYAAALADVRKAQADSDLKQRAFERQRDLEHAGVVALKDLESAQSDMRQSRAELDRAASRLRELAPGGGQGSTLVLRAPIDGVVADRQVTSGTEIRPDASQPLFVLTDPRKLWIMLDVPEGAARHLRTGQSVNITSDSDPSLMKTGSIANIPVVVDPATHRLTVRVVIDNPDGALRPEMLVRALPYADSGRLVARVPNNALVTVGYFTYAFVETGAGNYERRRVHVALTGHGESFVDSGLKAGERVVSTGALLLDSELRSGD